MIKTVEIAHTYSGNKEIQFPDIDVKKGDHLLILGSSGSGKTTLLHILSGLLQPTQGQLQIDEVEIDKLSQTKLDRFRGEKIGMVFQKPYLIKSLSVLQNLELASYLAGQKREISDYLNLLDFLGLEGLEYRKVHQLSQGQAQRVGIARAVVNEPAVLFCDEPTASLDDQSCNQVMNLILEQSGRLSANLIVATHDQRIKSYFENQLIL